MFTALPTNARTTGRGRLRVALGAALTTGLIALTPVSGAQAAPAHHHRHHAHHHKHHHQHHALGRAAGRVAHAANVAAAQKGDPYRYGAHGPSAFDCSGLTYFSFRHAGFKHIPRTSSAQAHFAKRISRKAMHRGDLVFFYHNGGVYHVGVFAGVRHGHRTIVHAPYSGAHVRRERIWTHKWFAGSLRYR